MANTAKGKQKNSNTKKPKQAPAQQQPKQKPELTEEQYAIKRQKTAIILLGISLILGALAFIEGESGWAVCHQFLFRIFGVCAYLLPFVMIYITIICAKDSVKSKMSTNVVSATGLFAFIAAAVHIFGHTTEYFKNTKLAPQISECWNNGEGTGGVLGALLGGSICQLLGKTGAAITAVVLLIVFVLLVTGTTLPLLFRYIKKPVKKVSQAAGEKFEENARRKIEAQEQRDREEEERKNRKPPEAPDEVDSKGRKKAPPAVSKPGTALSEPDMPVTSHIPAAVAAAAASAMPASVDGSPESASLIPELKTEEKTAEAQPAEEEKAAPVKKKKIVRKPVEDTTPQEEKFTPPEETAQQEASAYRYPSVELLDKPDNSGLHDSDEELRMGAKKLVETLESFKIKAEVTNIVRGPSVTRFELNPEPGVRISKITSLSDDIALRLAAKSVRIEAPIPGKAAIGIEVPNSTKSMVSMREIIDTDQYRAGSLKSKLNVALGKDITGNIITADLAKMPHLLVAGTTGSGKSVCLNTMIISILYNASPDEVKLLMIDPKQVEFTVYNGIAHLAVPVVSNPRKAAGALGWAVSEMEKRYAQFASTGVRDIKGFNILAEERDDLVKMHHIVIFIDELSDLMMASPKEVEDSICRLAQMARAAGIHLVIATQRPSVDVLTGIIKANIPSRIALYVSSQVDSRTILDQGGAEKLLGNGDMLFNPVGSSKPTRIQGCYISDSEVETVVRYVKNQSEAVYDDSIMREIEAKAAQAMGAKSGSEDEEENELDPMFNQAAEVVVLAGQASTTMLQKKLKLGYARASRVMDQLEENGIVGPSEGAKPRQVLLTKQDWYERQALSDGMGGKDEQLGFEDIMSNGSASEEEYYEEEEETEDTEFEAEEYEPEEIKTEILPEDEPDSDEDEEDSDDAGDMEIVEIAEDSEAAEATQSETYYDSFEDGEPVEYEDFESTIEDYDDLDEDDFPVNVDDVFDDEDENADEDIDDYFN